MLFQACPALYELLHQLVWNVAAIKMIWEGGRDGCAKTGDEIIVFWIDTFAQAILHDVDGGVVIEDG